jgi:hypothetical protein
VDGIPKFSQSRYRLGFSIELVRVYRLSLNQLAFGR